MTADQSKKIKDEYFLLRGKFESGRMTREEFLAATSKLFIQDDQGKTFVVDPETGTWIASDSPPHSADRATSEAVATANRDKPMMLPGRNRKSINKFVLAALVAFLAVCMMVIGIYGALSLNKSNTKIVSTTASAPGIAAKDFGTFNQLLATKIAALNQAQLKFIRDARALSYNNRVPGLASPLFQKGTALTEQDLKDISGKAMDVAILSDQLAELSGSQDKGSPKAAQSAEAYLSIARNAFSLVVDTQTVRQGLQAGKMPVSQAIDIMASYGTQLWNGAVTDGNSKNNPFSAQTKSGGESPTLLNPTAASQVNANNSSIWIAQAGKPTVKTLTVPAAQSPVSNPFDPQLLKSLTTADGQNDGNKAQQVAAANLKRLGATVNSSDPTAPTQLQVSINPVAVSGSDQLKNGLLPTFPTGKAVVISKNNPDDNNPFLNAFGLNGDQPPTN